MTLYTCMPLEIVLEGMNDKTEPLLEISLQGVKMQVMPIAPGIGKIVRLLDCNLYDYLNPSLTPGTIVNYS